jgi:hypothetical protein
VDVVPNIQGHRLEGVLASVGDNRVDGNLSDVIRVDDTPQGESLV